MENLITMLTTKEQRELTANLKMTSTKIQFKNKTSIFFEISKSTKPVRQEEREKN
jgi:hypothetical protein